ncbi:MAG: hypothetical protein OXF61_07510 [Acidimicrobiaceae bacterium]|nr:hypothetical protein [Acidimicrobiaceae bacterium]
MAQGIDRPLERVQARAHLTGSDVPSDQVADGSAYRDADRRNGQADQRTEDRKDRREHVAGPRKLKT